MIQLCFVAREITALTTTVTTNNLHNCVVPVSRCPLLSRLPIGVPDVFVRSGCQQSPDCGGVPSLSRVVQRRVATVVLVIDPCTSANQSTDTAQAAIVRGCH